jgi:hypothetical protein
VGLAAQSDRVCGRRRDRAGAASVVGLARAIPHLSGAGLAGRWRRWRHWQCGAVGRDHRLVVRLWLLPGWPLLDRPRFPGRCPDVRMAAANRSHGVAGWSRTVHSVRRCVGAAVMEQGPCPRARARGRTDDCGVAARTPVDRLSLECVRLRARNAARAGADQRAHRAVGPDRYRDCGLCVWCRARRQSGRHPPPVACASIERARARRHGGLRHG